MNQLSIRKNNVQTKKKKKGFTLVELIIVIAIIAILAAIALPRFGQIRENSNVSADIATAKTIQTAVIAGVANGDIQAGITLGATASAGNGNDLTDILSGGVVPAPKANGHTSDTFSATIDANGEVRVNVVSAAGATLQVIPQVAHAAGNPYSAAQ
jgi:type IV pilus assembly protein PilA